MTNKNKESTRYYSDLQEKSVCKVSNSKQQPNSGASTFSGGDCINRKASLLIECKTVMTEKDSFSIKKNWITKNRDEKFSQRLSNSCIAFSFGPEQENFFIIDEKLMRYLVEKLEEDNE
jgi:hypothetical protein